MSRPDLVTNWPEDAARYEGHHAVDDYDDGPGYDPPDEPDDWFAAVMADEPAEVQP